MTVLKFQLFYNGQESYDGKLITYNMETNVWTTTDTTYSTGIFGNFWPHKKTRINQQNLGLKVKLYDKEYIFSTSETAFQAAKCSNIEDIDKFTKEDLHAGDSFRLGRKIKLRDDWEDVKVNIMMDILKCKFTQFEDLKKVLLDTDDAFLIEHTPVKGRDKFWADDHAGTGQNNLGYCLMAVRVELGGKKPNAKCLEMLPQLYEFLK